MLIAWQVLLNYYLYWYQLNIDDQRLYLVDWNFHVVIDRTDPRVDTLVVIFPRSLDRPCRYILSKSCCRFGNLPICYNGSQTHCRYESMLVKWSLTTLSWVNIYGQIERSCTILRPTNGNSPTNMLAFDMFGEITKDDHGMWIGALWWSIT